MNAVLVAVAVGLAAVMVVVLVTFERRPHTMANGVALVASLASAGVLGCAIVVGVVLLWAAIS